MTSTTDLSFTGMRLLPALPGTELGVGFDSIEFDTRGTAWSDWAMPAPPTLDGKPGSHTKDIAYKVDLAIDETSLRDVLTLSASASFSSGSTSASASLQVYEETDVT